MKSGIVVLLFVSIVLCQVDEEKHNALLWISHNLAENYFDCEDLYRYGAEVFEDLKEFWNPSHLLMRPQTGCLLLCIGVKRGYLDNDGNIIEGKLLSDIRSMWTPALNEEEIEVLRSMGRQCHEEVKTKGARNDVCLTALQHAQCVRAGFIKLKWTPGPILLHRREFRTPYDSYRSNDVMMLVREIHSSSETMKHITNTFMKALEECKHEQNFSDHVMRDLYFYWKEDFTLIRRETGCAIVCMSHKLQLLDSTGQLHHGSAKEFALNHGAGEETATKLVTSIHECETQHQAEEDACMKALEVAKCFSKAIDLLNWTPKMDIMISEVLSDM